MSVGSPNPKYCVHEEITDDVVDSFSFNVKNFNQKINKLTNRTGADTGFHSGGCEIFLKGKLYTQKVKFEQNAPK